MRNNVKGSKNSIIPNMPKQKMIVGTLPQIFGLMQGASFLLIQKALQRWDAGCGITHPARLGTPPRGNPQNSGCLKNISQKNLLCTRNLNQRRDLWCCLLGEACYYSGGPQTIGPSR